MALEDQPNVIETSVLTLMTDIIVEILLRLPVESVLRCKSVCKAWYSLISDPRFINSHLSISTRNNVHDRLIFSTRRRKMLKSCPLYDSLYDNKSMHALKLEFPFKRARDSVWIVGSCNGLVCIAVEEDVISKALFIWNPSTRRTYRLPSNGHTGWRFWSMHYGFGYDESTNDYKVVEIGVRFIERFKHETSVEIYSLRNGNWKNVGAFPYGMPTELRAKFLNGALHWAANKDYSPDFSANVEDEDGVPVIQLSYDWGIISWDLANETYGEVMQPEFDERDDFMDFELGCLREWLCVLSNCCGVCVNLWVMKDYGVKDSWTKLVSIPYMTEPETGRYLMPLCISNEGKVLVQLGSKLIVYDSKNGSISEKQSCAKVDQASTFVESLVSPMPAAAL